MSRLKWSPAELRRLKKYWPITDGREITKYLKRKTYDQCKNRACKEHITKLVRYKKKYSKQDLDYIKKHYPNGDNHEIAKKFNTTARAIATQAFQLGVKKTDEWKVQQGIRTGWQKGQVSHNKGKKMSKATYEKVKHTMFKKGNMPHNRREENVITLRIQKGGYMQWWMRETGTRRMRPLQNIIFEEHFGRPVKKNHFIVFKDLDSLNCNPENLLEVDRRGHLNKIRWSDSVIAHHLSALPGGKGLHSAELKEEFLKHPEIINLKRQYLLLQETLKSKRNVKRTIKAAA